MALIPQVVGTAAGVASGARTAATGDTITPGADVQLVVVNGSGSSITVTITGKQVCSQGFTHDAGPVTCPAGATTVIGPINDRFKDPTTGLASVVYTGTLTSVTVYTSRV